MVVSESQMPSSWPINVEACWQSRPAGGGEGQQSLAGPPFLRRSSQTHQSRHARSKQPAQDATPDGKGRAQLQPRKAGAEHLSKCSQQP